MVYPNLFVTFEIVSKYVFQVPYLSYQNHILIRGHPAEIISGTF